MKDFKLVACDNKTSAGMAFVGKEARFSYDGSRFYFSSLYSSRVATISNINGMMLVQTRNTLYTFEPAVKEEPMSKEDALLAFV